MKATLQYFNFPFSCSGTYYPSSTESQVILHALLPRGPSGEGTAHNDLYGEAPPKTATFCGLQVRERVGKSLVGVYEKVGESVISVCKRAQKGYQMNFMAFKSRENVLFFEIDAYLKDCIYSS